MTISADPNYQAQNIQYTQPQAYVAQPAPTVAAAPVLGLDVKSATFWTGAAIGAGITLLVTNEAVQTTVVKTVSRIMAAAAGGVEEIKEKYEDAKAEVEAEAAKD